MSESVKVTFLEDRKVRDEKGDEFKKGKTYTMTRDSAYHWIRRGAAVEGTSKDAKDAKEAQNAE